MNDLFKKLNVLVKASLKDAVGGVGGETTPKPASAALSKSVDRDITALRDRINEAVRYEDEIKSRIRRYEDEADRWDREADAAVARNDDEAARYAIEHMQRAQQRATIAESDLRDHQRSTQDLIQRVNELDAAVADARREHPEAAENSPLPDLSNVLREAREKIATLGEMAAARSDEAEPDAELSTETPMETTSMTSSAPPVAPPKASPSEAPTQTTAATPTPTSNLETQPTDSKAAVDDDLERRRQRLSKR